MKNTIRINKGLIIALFAMMFSITTLQAQQGQQNHNQQGPPPIPNEKQIQKMVADISIELSLTDTQTEEVSKIFFAHFEEAKEKMENNKSERPSRKEMEKLSKDFEKEVKAQLTDEQQKQFDAFMKKQKPPQERQK